MGINVSSKASSFSINKLSSILATRLPDPDTFSESIDYNIYNFSDETISYQEINNDGFTTQGMTQAKDKLLITGYKHGEKSRIYIYDIETGKYEGYIILDNSAHVGGTSYDQEHDILYVTGSSGTVNAYDYSVISNYYSSDDPVIIDINTISDPHMANDNAIAIKMEGIDISEYGGAATTYYYDGKLYVSTFVGNDNGLMQVYDMKVTKDEYGFKHITPTLSYQIEMPTQVQGIAITDYNGKRYLLVTQSISSPKSDVLIYEIDESGNLTYLGKHYFRHGLEGIDVDSEGNVRIVSEFGAQETIHTTMDELLTNFERNKPISEGLAFICGAAWQRDFSGSLDQAKKNWQMGMEAINTVIAENGVYSPEVIIGLFGATLGATAAPVIYEGGKLVVDVVTEPFEQLADEFSSTWDEHDMSDRFSKAGVQFSNWDIIGGLTTSGSAMWDYGSDIASDAWEGICDTGAEVADFFVSLWPF